MSSSRSRDRKNKSATTFWMDNDLKKKAQDRAGILGMTLTDLINRSVEIYLIKGADLEDDEEWQKKLAAANISSSIKESGLSFEKIDKIDDDVESVKAKVKVLEDRWGEYERETGTIEVKIKNEVQNEIERKITPIIDRVSMLLEQITKS